MTTLQPAIDTLIALIHSGGAEAARDIHKGVTIDGAQEASQAWRDLFWVEPDVYLLADRVARNPADSALDAELRALLDRLLQQYPQLLPAGFPVSTGGVRTGEPAEPPRRRGRAKDFSVGTDNARAGKSVAVYGAAAESTKGVVYPIWFGTNRKPVGSSGFGPERHDRTTRGRVLVHVPEAHRKGETGSGFWKHLRRLDFRDDSLRIQKVETRERDAFFAELNAAMKAVRDEGSEPQALFFLHGYNTSFEEAAIRAAQIGYDLEVEGATAFFSWPSRGTVAGYPADEATIEASERAIGDFLLDFSTHCGAAKVHVIAHSMGNRGLLRALQRIAADAETRGKLKLGQIFLAAPDVDRGLFMDLARLYPEYGERTTLYASAGDKAVHLSAKVHDAPRAGYFSPYTVAPGIDTVVVPDFDVDLLGHGYFAQAEAMLHDIFDLMRHGAPPAKRGLTSAEDGSFWKLSK